MTAANRDAALSDRFWVLHVHELEDGRLVFGGEMPSPDWREWCIRLAAAVKREIAGEELGLPGPCPAALGTAGDRVAGQRS